MQASWTAEDDPAWERRIVCAEVNSRRVNEAIERGHGDGGSATFICECGRVGCTQKLDLTIEQYEDVRTSFDRFLLAPGHAMEAIESVAEDHGTYVVTVKEGAAAELADDTDPRGDELDRT